MTRPHLPPEDLSAATAGAALKDWLRRIEGRHPREMELGLDRIRPVLQAMGLATPPFEVISVSGTNGKGSTVTLLESLLRAQGLRTGRFMSPHLVDYNERIAVDGQPVSDAECVAAFERIDAACGSVRLTYFEYGTLAAFDIFARRGVTHAVCEVGLGGRLDAVNVLDARAAAITSIGLDHQRWLGTDREAIGREKAGIMRPGRPAICGERDVPRSIPDEARRIGARLSLIGQDFDWHRDGVAWHWRGGSREVRDLPMPRSGQDAQLDNAAVAIMTLSQLGLLPDAATLRRVMATQTLDARFQVIAGQPEWIVDVAHNAEAATALAQGLRRRPVNGRTWVVIGMLRDKPVGEVIRALAGQAHGWIATTALSHRAIPGLALAREICVVSGAAVHVTPGVASGCMLAREFAAAEDRVVITGSFAVAGPALAWLGLYSDESSHRTAPSKPPDNPVS